MRKILTDVEKNICLEYLLGNTNKYISEKYNLHRTTIQRILKKNNIILRKQENTSRKNLILNFNGEIRSNNDAYILGLIYSDGNLYKNNIEISLKDSDKQILTDISEYVYGYVKLSYRKGGLIEFKDQKYNVSGQYRFLISSKSIVSKLKLYGLHENKSLTIEYPNIPNKYDKHFIRGFFDGDGCIFISKKYKNTHKVTITTNLKMCQQISKIINTYLKINSRIYEVKDSNVFRLTISGNTQIKKFMNWIYDDSDLKLDRKYNLFKTL